MAHSDYHRLAYDPAERGARRRRIVSKIRGVKLFNEYEGTFRAGAHSTRLKIESSDSVRIIHDVEGRLQPDEALETNLHLPGNVRFAQMGGRVSLLADTRLDGEEHLASSFREMGQGLRAALERPWRPRRFKTAPIAPADVQDALERTDWDADAVVRLEDAWEVRPRIRGEAMPVHLAIVGQSLHIERQVVVDCLHESVTAVAYQALSINAALRHARLAWNGSAVMAEARLHAGLIDASWLVHAVRAVATATHYSRPTLEILARQIDVARHFMAMFLSRQSKPRAEKERR